MNYIIEPCKCLSLRGFAAAIEPASITLARLGAGGPGFAITTMSSGDHRFGDAESRFCTDMLDDRHLIRSLGQGSSLAQPRVS